MEKMGGFINLLGFGLMGMSDRKRKHLVDYGEMGEKDSNWEVSTKNA